MGKRTAQIKYLSGRPKPAQVAEQFVTTALLPQGTYAMMIFAAGPTKLTGMRRTLAAVASPFREGKCLITAFVLRLGSGDPGLEAPVSLVRTYF